MKAINVPLSRTEITDLMTACEVLKHNCNNGTFDEYRKWKELYDKLETRLRVLDRKPDVGGLKMRKHTDLSTKFLMEIIENGTYDTPVMRYVYDKSEGTIRCAGHGRLDDPDAWQLVASDIKEN